MYWIIIYLSLLCCVIYNFIIAKKYNIKRWKFIVITLVAFVYNWGVSYLTAFVEAGFQSPPSVNGVRAWVYVPFYMVLCSAIFHIDFRRLSDALTPCFPLGFAFGHIGCVFAGCCHGYEYDGLFAIYNSKLGYNTFPIQIIESICTFILFAAFVIYTYKCKYVVTGRLYPILLIAYTMRFVFEFFRDNEKIWLCFSSLAFHALFGGIVGAIWLFFTTAAGKLVAVKIINFFRQLLKKEKKPILSKEEYALMIRERQQNSIVKK